MTLETTEIISPNLPHIVQVISVVSGLLWSVWVFRVLVTINNNYYHYEIFLCQFLLTLLKLLPFTFTAVNITLYNYLVDQFYPQFKVFLPLFSTHYHKTCQLSRFCHRSQDFLSFLMDSQQHSQWGKLVPFKALLRLCLTFWPWLVGLSQRNDLLRSVLWLFVKW